MKKSILCLVLLGVTMVSCKKNFDKTIIGEWTETEHIIDGSEYDVETTINFHEDGSYITKGFTYPWHCEPGAKNDDIGTWSYDKKDKTLLLTSTKTQSHWDEYAQQFATHSNAKQIMNVTLIKNKTFKVEFTDVNCDQTVKLTFSK